MCTSLFDITQKYLKKKKRSSSDHGNFQHSGAYFDLNIFQTMNAEHASTLMPLALSVQYLEAHIHTIRVLRPPLPLKSLLGAFTSAPILQTTVTHFSLKTKQSVNPLNCTYLTLLSGSSFIILEQTGLS